MRGKSTNHDAIVVSYIAAYEVAHGAQRTE